MRTDIRGINQSVWLSDISQCDMFNIRFTVVEDTNHGRPNKLYTMTHHLFQRNAVSMSPTICRGARACRTHIYYQAGQATINYQPSNMKSIRTGNMIVRHWHKATSIARPKIFCCLSRLYHVCLFKTNTIPGFSFHYDGILFVVDVNIWTKIIYQNVTQGP